MKMTFNSFFRSTTLLSSLECYLLQILNTLHCYHCFIYLSIMSIIPWFGVGIVVMVEKLEPVVNIVQESFYLELMSLHVPSVLAWDSPS